MTRTPHQHVHTVISHRMQRVRAVHRFNPMSRVCFDCGVSEIKNANDGFDGIPCKNQKKYHEWDETVRYLSGDCYCDKPTLLEG